jgi:recombination protein RecA
MRLLVSQPGSGEEALRICETLVRSNALDVIVIDSVAALVTRQELEGDIGDSTVGAQARLMSAALRKLTAIISKARTDLHLHQPDPRKDRRHVWQSRNHPRRTKR